MGTSLKAHVGLLLCVAAATVARADDERVSTFQPFATGDVFVAATVKVMSDAGGTRALVEQLARLARSRRSGLVATWASGMVIFFDDYANCLVVGSAMRPLTDRLRISREKLAYLIDSTAALAGCWLLLVSLSAVVPMIGYPWDQLLLEAGLWSALLLPPLAPEPGGVCAPLQSTSSLAGIWSNVGASVSTTSIVCVQLALLPQSSVAVHARSIV